MGATDLSWLPFHAAGEAKTRTTNPMPQQQDCLKGLFHTPSAFQARAARKETP
jgi:hypothetical protein